MTAEIAQELPRLTTRIPEGASMAERAYYELRDRIVSLRIPPGTLIREEDVMKDLEMSRTPIREALLRLSHGRLVVVIPRRGTFVTDVHVGDVGRIYEFRRELEAVAAGWAAERRSDADVPEIEKMMEELRAVGGAPTSEVDARSQISSDQRAHHLVYQLSDNPLIEDVLDSCYFLAARVWFLASGRVTMQEPFGGLVEVLEAISDRDTEAARHHARYHSETAEAAIRAAL